MAKSLIPSVEDGSVMLPRHRRLVKWLIGTSVAATAGWLFASADYKLSGFWSIIRSPEGVAFLLQSIMSIALGVLSAVFFSTFENKYARARLNDILSIAPRNLLEGVLSFVEQEQERGFVFDETIEFILGPAKEHDNFLVMRASFSYKKVLKTRDLFFKFLFLRTEAGHDVAKNQQAAVDALYRVSESFVQYPDSHLRAEFGDQLVDEAHRVVHLKVDGSDVQLSAVAGDPTLRLYRLPDSKNLDMPVRLDYAYEFPVAKADIIFGLAECLTQGLTIKFVRDGSIRDKIDAEAFEIMSAAQGSPVIIEDPVGTHSVKDEGWVIPKSGAVFHWWPVA